MDRRENPSHALLTLGATMFGMALRRFDGAAGAPRN